MLCPSCKKEVPGGELLIHWYLPNGEVGICWGDVIEELRADLAKYGSSLAGFEFEHDVLDCFHHWNPSQTDVEDWVEEELLKPKLTNDFLDTLVQAANTCEWAVDFIEVAKFVDWCFRLAYKPVPPLDVYNEEENNRRKALLPERHSE